MGTAPDSRPCSLVDRTAISAEAQWLDRKTPGIPRTPDGKPNLTAPAPRGPDGKPDLTGVWEGDTPVGRPTPADLQPWVLDRASQYQQEYYKTRPYYQCRPSGPEAERFGGWKRILQTPAAIAILQDDLTYRVIHTDGRALEAALPHASDLSHPRAQQHYEVLQSLLAPGACEALLDAGEQLARELAQA